MDNFLVPLRLMENLQIENDFIIFSGINSKIYKNFILIYAFLASIYGLWFFDQQELLGFSQNLDLILGTKLTSSPPVTKNVTSLLQTALQRKISSLRTFPPTLNDVFGSMIQAGYRPTSQPKPENFIRHMAQALLSDKDLTNRILTEYSQFLYKQ